MYDTSKLKAGNNKLIWHDWYTSHVTVVDNTDETWETSSAIKGNDGVSVPTLYLFLWFYLSFIKSRLDKKLEKQAKNRYFDITDITANFEY